MKKAYFISTGGCLDAMWTDKCCLDINEIPKLFELFLKDYNSNVKQVCEVVVDVNEMEVYCTFVNKWNETEKSKTFQIIVFDSI